MKVSIITVTWNSESTLKDTLDSVLFQTYDDIEHIIVDGKSIDSTMSIVKSYESRYKGNLKYISEPDHGIYDAMNKGISMATGDIVGILNSDDFYTSNDVVECVVKSMQNINIDAVYADVHYVHDSNLNKCIRYYSSQLFSRRLMRFGLMPAHPSFYCRRIIYEKCGLFDLSYKVAADFENLLRLLYIHRIRTLYIHKDFVTMRTGGASSSGLHSHMQIMKDHLRALKKNGIYSNILLLSLRYPYKLYEIIATKISNLFNSK